MSIRDRQARPLPLRPKAGDTVPLPTAASNPPPQPPQKDFRDYFVAGSNGKVEIVMGDHRFWKDEVFQKVLDDVDRIQAVRVALGYEPTMLEKFGMAVLLSHAQNHGWKLEIPVK